MLFNTLVNYFDIIEEIIYIKFLLQDVKGPQTVAFNLPNDECIVNQRGTCMVLLKNVSEAKYLSISLYSFLRAVGAHLQNFTCHLSLIL
jgi:hypothetical protein